MRLSVIETPFPFNNFLFLKILCLKLCLINLTIISLSFFFVLEFWIRCDRSKSFGKICISISSLTVLMIMLQVSSTFSSFILWKGRQFLWECLIWYVELNLDMSNLSFIFSLPMLCLLVYLRFHFFKSLRRTGTCPRKLLIVSSLSFLSASNSWNFSERKLTVSARSMSCFSPLIWFSFKIFVFSNISFTLDSKFFK